MFIIVLLMFKIKKHNLLMTKVGGLGIRLDLTEVKFFRQLLSSFPEDKSVKNCALLAF